MNVLFWLSYFAFTGLGLSFASGTHRWLFDRYPDDSALWCYYLGVAITSGVVIVLNDRCNRFRRYRWVWAPLIGVVAFLPGVAVGFAIGFLGIF
ncbi:MAG TPA: hypothetical protein VHP11_04345 [Tepidisphaeraceae bacterium]|nr:hypothetical protein [Tepidisphaeraceae bacterium]